MRNCFCLVSSSGPWRAASRSALNSAVGLSCLGANVTVARQKLEYVIYKLSYPQRDIRVSTDGYTPVIYASESLVTTPVPLDFDAAKEPDALQRQYQE